MMIPSLISQRRALVAATIGCAATAAFVVLRRCRVAARARQRDVRKHKPEIHLLYGTKGGNARTIAEKLRVCFERRDFAVRCSNLAEIDAEDLPSLATESGSCRLLIFVVSTWDNRPPPECEGFFSVLESLLSDQRVPGNFFAAIHFAVVGLGSTAHVEWDFCLAAKRLQTMLCQREAKEFVSPLFLNDVEDNERGLDRWALRLVSKVEKAGRELQSEAPTEVAQDFVEDHDALEDEDDADDIEDLVEKGDPVEHALDTGNEQVLRDMLTAKRRAALQKKYSLIGSHSAVKLCRWTKSQLRGRGGCYKHTFYGIQSHRCMEATPSMACANRCTFCWRGDTHPVGTEWKWNMDSPEMIVKESLKTHIDLVKSHALAAVGGAVAPERYSEGLEPKHCALSLVGEPIMYPKINGLVEELHDRGISTFMVTNAQFPDAIRNLVPVTQLYVSVDAANPHALKAVDRPLFPDYWDRFVECLSLLKQKQQRTVYRLTLVQGKGGNMEDIDGYARLVILGLPDFIELKAVTLLAKDDEGKGKAKSSLERKENAPFHDAIRGFSQQLRDALQALHVAGQLEEEYDLACEHQHSSIVLLAKKKFFRAPVTGGPKMWHTWIDYRVFHDLVKSDGEFTAMDYSAPTPSWAAWDAEERGFDPAESRFLRKNMKQLAAKGVLPEGILKQFPGLI